MTKRARPKILVVYGTRPEAIKMAPLVKALETSRCLEPVVAVTGQHRAMLDQVNELFDIRPAFDLNIITERQQLQDVTAKVLLGISSIIADTQPDAVVVQGDTTTCFASALAGFNQKVPVIHVEAGLRTNDSYNPFPEEMNRRLTTRLASLHLAPTKVAKANLLADNVPLSSIMVTGNTVIDALLEVIAKDLPIENAALAALAHERLVLCTAHRRESWGDPMANNARAIAKLAVTYPDVKFLLPAHLNPAIREVLLPPLQALPNVVVTEPLGYSDLAHALKQAEIILTDSGGIQEEAPSLGKPVLVLRDTTERPEAVAAGTVKLVGTNEDRIVAEASKLLTDRSAYDAMAHAVNPYGDGRAARRSVEAIAHYFGLGPKPEDFAIPAVRASSLAAQGGNQAIEYIS